jgi:excisionase family DNA binding protein
MPKTPLPAQYLSKDIAAKELGMSVRRLMELSQNGRIERSKRPDPVTGRETTIIAVEYVALLKDEMTPKAVAVVPPLPRPVAPIGRPWLTLAEAAEYSGLPAAFLRDLIAGGQLRALNVGVREGGRYRVRRSDLDEIQGHTFDGIINLDCLR